MINLKQLQNKLKETPKMLTRAKNNYSMNKFLLTVISQQLSNEEETALAHMIRNILQEELQTKEVVLQEIVSSNLKVTNERLEKLSGEFSDIKESL